MRKVLVVDDEPLIIEVVSDALEDVGYKATKAMSFSEAVTLLNSTGLSFECIVVDKNLGREGSGWDLARIARERNETVGVVYISGADAKDWASEGVPGSVMLQKPFSRDQIITAVSRFVESPSVLALPGASHPGLYVEVLEAMFEHAPGFMAFSQGVEPRYTFANKAFRQLVGNRPLFGHTATEAIPELAGQGILEIISRVYRTGEPFVAYGMPINLERSPGNFEQKFLDVMYHVVRAKDGTAVGMLVQGHDVTQDRRAQERLEVLRREAIENARIKTMDAMAAAIAHELNQPLTAISNYMWAAEQFVTGAEYPEALANSVHKAGEAALRAGDIIRKLRLMTKKGRSEPAVFELQKASHDAVDLALAGITDVAVTFATGPAIYVLSDPVQFMQVIINLVRNACDAMRPHGGAIAIYFLQKEDFAQVCVSDSGPGIPPDLLPVIFEAFTTSKPDGMGIGLSICKEIVGSHGGRIRAENNAGGGASICFTLPLAEPDGARLPQQALSAEQH
jgi:signal transduction histidine kinase/CheY-like chemotaxis protein